MTGLMDMQVIAGLFLFFLALFGLIYYLIKKTAKPKRLANKKRIYACGESMKPERMNVNEGSFYNSIIRSLGLKRIRELHAGYLTDYIFWIIGGMVVLIILLVVLW